MLLSLVIFICAAVQVNSRTYNVQMISWVNNPPYYAKQHERIGMVAQTFKYHFYNYKKINNTLQFKINDNPKYHLQTEDDLIDLLSETNKTRLLQRLNTTSDSQDIFIASATTKRVKGLFTPVEVMKRKEVVVIMRTSDLLFITQLAKGFWNCRFLIYISVLCAINLAAVLWLVERKYNKGFRNEFGAGLWTSLWYCIVTMTTVGYGDKVPKKLISRVLCVFWMFSGIMLTAMITATIMESVQGESSKVGMRIAISRSSIEGSFVQSQLSAIPVKYNTYQEIMDAVSSKKVDAGILDTNTAAYVFKHQNIQDLKMETSLNIHKTIWAFAYRNAEAMNLTLSFNQASGLVSDEAEMRVRTHFVPSYIVSRYYNRNFDELFNGQDNGLVLYLTIIASCLVAFGTISKSFTELRKFYKQVPTNDNNNDIALEEINRTEKNLPELDTLLVELENQFKERIERFRQEMEEKDYLERRQEKMCDCFVSLSDRFYRNCRK